ncbi:class I SAM-dependent methyltransferase [Endozoicomonas sp. Mp262]|uniref:class I SAM-dependent methyltransferase n=1 Tax=Endozoicomonas sp. Mp262 TaxID=2919499 RepID=UPI0021D8B77A
MSDDVQTTDFKDRMIRLGRWLESPAGRPLIKAERRCIDFQLRTVFGYYACQTSPALHYNWLENSQTGHHFAVTPFKLECSGLSQMVCDPYFWPVEPGSLDLVLLHHTLDIAESPHRLLSEAASTIISNGKLLVVGFNPLSLSFIARWLIPERVRAFQGTRFISVRRLRDWLTLLGFRTEQVHYGAYTAPLDRLFKGISAEFIEQRCDHWRLPIGSFYSILATREDHGITPIQKAWPRVKNRLVGRPIARPSAGRYGESS